MAAERTKYTEEYRIETADYALSTGRPAAEIATELGINPKTLNRWIVKRRKELADPGAAVDAKTEDAELKAARKRIHELEMENEFLKKASAYNA